MTAAAMLTHIFPPCAELSWMVCRIYLIRIVGAMRACSNCFILRSART